MQTTRETLLDLAEREVCARGFGAVSYGDLAALAGIRKASIHHHFPAKADLGFALIDRFGDRTAEKLARLSATARTGGEAMRSFIAECRQSLNEGQATGLLTALMADAPQLSEPIRRALDRAQAMVAEWLGRTMQRGRQDRTISVAGDPMQEGLAALAQLTGAEIAARAAGDPAVFDRATATLAARMFRS